MESREAESDSLESTASLLVRIREGDERALDTLVGRYLVMLGRWAHGRLPSGARDLVDTDDIVQNTLMGALNNLGTFQSRGEGAFLAYLRQAILNRLRDAARRAQRRPLHLELDPALDATGGSSPLEEVIGHDRLESYEDSLQQLGDSQREAVILRLELGMRYRDVAEALNLSSAEAARALIGRGMVRLARLMRDHHE